MPDDLEDLSLSRTFKMVEGRLALEDTFEKILQASFTGAGSKHSDDLIGSVVDSKYKVLSLLGEGGMGTVYRVLHLLLNKEMALKTFRTANLSPDAWRRFQREAQAIGKLTHANIVQVFDFGIGEQNFPYYTMELLVGESLADRLARLTRLESKEALAIFLAVAAGMAHAHRQGIVHRDIKPANIFIKKSKAGGIPKIVDFGLAKLAASQSLDIQSVTGGGLVFGSPLYMSPEQSNGLETDQRTDIYSFGCSLFQALTGKPPFVGDSLLATIYMHQQDAPPRLVQAAPDVKFPERLEAIVAKLLAKRAKERYQSFEEVEKDLSLLDLSRVKAAANGPADIKENSPGTEAEAETEEVQSDDQRAAQKVGGEMRSVLLQALGVVLLIGLAGLAIVLISQKRLGSSSLKTSASVVSGARAKHGPELDVDLLPATEELDKRGPIVEPAAPGVAAETLKPPPPFFLKKTARGTTIFKFPKEGIGEVASVNQAHSVEAAEIVEVPIGGQFKAGPFLSNHPIYFRGFGPNDLTDLSLQRNLLWNGRHFAEIAKLKSLRELYLTTVRLDASDLKYFDKLPNLVHLNVSETGLSGKDLAQMSRIDQIQYLEANKTRALMPLFDRLQKGSALTALSVKRCGLGDEELKKIAGNRQLAVLCIDGNPFTAAGLRPLAGLPGLFTLRMGTEHLGPEVIDVLRDFKHLAILRIDTTSWSPVDRDRLTRVLPKGCTQEPPE